MKKAITALCCAVALAVFVAPGARADEYTKQTFLTFSGPVQVPGATLPAGTYMFKLADPESGRRAIQIWDKEGSDIIATLLTIPNQRMEPADEPVVLFQETASGQPQAVRAWFYPGDRYGMEFIYPKDQAMKIAQGTNSSVLAYDSNQTTSDTAAMRGQKVGRVDASGQLSADADTADSAVPSVTAERANTTDNTSGTTTADNTAAASAQTAQSGQANPTPPAAPATSADRAATAGRTSDAATPVGTSGQDRPATAAPSAQGTTRQELPRTASSATALQLFAGFSLLGAVAARQFRRRYAATRVR